MSFAKHNAAVVNFTFETPKTHTYKDLAVIAKEYGVEAYHRVRAIYINKKGKYGAQPVLATDNELVNAPHHMVDAVREILEDGESISMINNGVAGFKLYTYENQHGTQYSIEWVDLLPE